MNAGPSSCRGDPTTGPRSDCIAHDGAIATGTGHVDGTIVLRIGGVRGGGSHSTVRATNEVVLDRIVSARIPEHDAAVLWGVDVVPGDNRLIRVPNLHAHVANGDELVARDQAVVHHVGVEAGLTTRRDVVSVDHRVVSPLNVDAIACGLTNDVIRDLEFGDCVLLSG